MDENVKKLPRGIRNNNPGNIRLSGVRWQGQKKRQLDPAFAEFETPLMGLRALMVLLLTYYRKHGLNTVESLLNRYAPPHENATDHYIHSVAKALMVKRQQPIKVEDSHTLCALARAITRFENGSPREGEWYEPPLYAEAARLALEAKRTKHRKEETA